MNSHILNENEKVVKVGKVSRSLVPRVEDFELAIPEETMKALIDLIDNRIYERLKKTKSNPNKFQKKLMTEDEIAATFQVDSDEAELIFRTAQKKAYDLGYYIFDDLVQRSLVLQVLGLIDY